jgi:hypothetical protein
MPVFRRLGIAADAENSSIGHDGATAFGGHRGPGVDPISRFFILTSAECDPIALDSIPAVDAAGVSNARSAGSKSG